MAIVFYELCAGGRARRFGPACWKARMALSHKGLDFEVQATPDGEIRRIGDGSSPTVPVIDDGERCLDLFGGMRRSGVRQTGR